MKLLAIAGKDLRQVLRDRRAFIFLLLMPLAFTLFFGLAIPTTGAGSHDARLQLGLLDADGSALSTQLRRALADSGGVRPEPLDAVQAGYVDDLVRRGDYAGVLRIPAGWGAALAGGAPEPVTLVVDRSTPAGLATAQAVDAAVERFLGAQRVANAVAGATSNSAAAGGRPAPDVAAVLDAWRAPPLTLATHLAGAGETPAGAAAEGPYDQASPGMIVQFAIYGLILSAMVLVIERKQRALARLATTPTPRAVILAGHALAMLAVVLAQVLVLEAFGQWALGVNYLASPVATAALTLALCVWASSLGMLLGAFARSEEQVVAWSLVAMFVLSGLGGAWFPLEVTSATFRRFAHAMPTAWAMDGFRNVLLRGAGLAQTLQPVLVLLAFAAAFLVLAVGRLARRPD
ncbi:MAG TPA: ABC transporter permease [Trueperaceae bacterium]|nr:ABC transporter permease [Trueperaceae bacterium]